MKFFGLLICFAIIGGAVVQIGPHLFNDVMSGIFVLGGALGFTLLKNKPQHMTENFGVGALYFGWRQLCRLPASPFRGVTDISRPAK